MPLPPEADAIIQQLTGLYEQAQRNIVDELVRVGTLPDPHGRMAIRQARLHELERSLNAELSQLNRAAHEWFTGQLPEVFRLGAEQGGLQWNWTGAAREAVQQLAADAYDDLLAATRYVRRDTKAFIGQATKLHVSSTLLEGQTAARQGVLLAKRLADRGIAAVTYRNGARHGIGEYGQMVVRTKSAQAYNRGAFMSARDNGVQWMECYDGPACGLTAHDDPELANGTIRPLDEAESWPIAHPNCARSWGPRPDVNSKKEADAARRYSPEEQQQLAQAERARVAAQQARRPGRPSRAQASRPSRPARPTRPRATRPTRPTPAAPPQVQPTGVHPSTAIASKPGARSAVGRGVDHSLEQIAKVHRIPEGLPPIPVKPSSARSYYGQYSYRLSGSPEAIRIQTTGDHIAGTFAHEFGHYLDHQANLVGQVDRIAETSPALAGRPLFGTTPVGMKDPLMRQLFDAIEATPTWEKLAELAKAPGARLNGASYYASKKEAWARAYHQWIATKTADPTMLAELDHIVGLRHTQGSIVRGHSQWPADEFGPIAAAFDAIFRAKGLLV